MAKSNRDITDEGLSIFTAATAPWTVAQMKAKHNDAWESKVVELLRNNPSTKRTVEDGKVPTHWDVTTLFSVISGDWPYHFRHKLEREHRTLLNEIKQWRDDHAHQKPVSADDAYRALDTVHRFLQAIGAGEHESVLSAAKSDLLRKKFDESKRNEKRRARNAAQLMGAPLEGLQPWRAVVQPHPDVASGDFMVAEFAADLAQVHRGDGQREYADPAEFFRRTHLTQGLRSLLLNAFKRLHGKGGDPVIELQTNFGGGKTHSMLALYHLCSIDNPGDMVGIESLMQEAGITSLPETRRAVLVGTALSPALPNPAKPDGTMTRTLWGEMAWQLDGKNGYEQFAEADANGGAPASNHLVTFFKTLGPTLILIDEWVAYIRQMYETQGLPGGSFESNTTFVQALAEAVKACPNVLLVASLPQSRIESAGEGGAEALAILENTFARIESSWEPASRDESFEIVRRRLFEPLTDRAFAARDSVAREFGTMYRADKTAYPPDACDPNYEELIESAYPVHPELFARLYEDWASLEQFQRTRGVLRLMAKIIHKLWMDEDKNLLIMPSTVPLDDLDVREELTRYLSNTWKPLIDTDVDGEASVPYRLDAENPAFAKVSAARRVARTVFMGSAPIDTASNHSVNDQQVRLGCVQPGEQAAPFGDAIRKLSDQCTHLYSSGSGTWYELQPNINRTAKQLAERFDDETVLEEVRRRLRSDTDRGMFGGVHAGPDTSADVPDDMDARLVVLGPSHAHVNNAKDSAAATAANEFLARRGNQPRIYRNMLVFVACDQTQLQSLLESAREYLAWKQLATESDALNLTPHNTEQVKQKVKDTDRTTTLRLAETWRWLMVPDQPEPDDNTITWDHIKLSAGAAGQSESLAKRAGDKLQKQGQIYPEMGSAILRLHLDRVLMQDKSHLCVKQLSEWFAQYLYLPRLTSVSVLASAIREGLGKLTWSTDTFAYADRHDQEGDRYVGLVAGDPTIVESQIRMDGQSVLVHSDVAKKQTDAETTPVVKPGDDGVTPDPPVHPDPPIYPPDPPVAVATKPTRFNARVSLKADRPLPDAQKIVENVIQHLVGTQGAKVNVTLLIDAEHEDGFEANVSRTVQENCNSLNFESHEFHEG